MAGGGGACACGEGGGGGADARIMPRGGAFEKQRKSMKACTTASSRHCALAVRREGMSRIAEADSGSRFERVGQLRPHASDHALVSVDIV